MLSYELIQDVQKYLDENLIEEPGIGNAITPDFLRCEDIACLNEEVSEEPAGNVEEPVAQYELVKDAANSGYNPENDFPIPSFLKSAQQNVLKNSIDARPDEEEDKPQEPKHHGSMFSRFKSLMGVEDIEDDEEDEDNVCEERLMPLFESPMASISSCKSDSISDLRERLEKIDESFGDMLVKKIDSLGMTDVDCYKKAQLNRSHFNRIKNDPEYHVQKETVFALALALSLNKADTDAFLAKAGYAFSSGSRSDLIIEYCINKGIYDVIEVNQLLYAFDQKLLGAGIRE